VIRYLKEAYLNGLLKLIPFVPLHTAARAITELRHMARNYAHIVHPAPVTWNTIMGYISEILHIPVIPYDDWLTRLDDIPSTSQSLKNIPALQLLEFYQGYTKSTKCGDPNQGVSISPMYELTGTIAAAPSLSPSRLPKLSREDVKTWIDYWIKKGALKAPV